MAVKIDPDNLYAIDTLACNQYFLKKVNKSKENFQKILDNIQNKDDLVKITIEIARKVFEQFGELEKLEKKISNLK